MGALDALLFGVREIVDAVGNVLPRRSRVKFTGNVWDDQVNDRTVVEIPDAASIETDDDVGRSVVGGAIDRVLGLAGVALSGTPGIGEFWTKHVSGVFKSGKPAHHGAYRPEDYGSCGDGTDPALGSPNAAYADAAFAAMLNAINSNATSAYQGATILLRERFTYFFETPEFEVDRANKYVGQGGASAYTQGTSAMAFAMGGGIWIRARGLDVPRGSGAEFYGIRFIYKKIAGVLDYAHDTVHSVGQLRQYLHDRSLLLEVVQVAGDAKTQTAMIASGEINPALQADAVWAANAPVSHGDIILPPPSLQNGHVYQVIGDGNLGATPPDRAVYGGFPWWAYEPIVNGDVVLQEVGVYLHSNGHHCTRPFAGSEHAAIKRANSTTYHHNAVVRVPGSSAQLQWGIAGMGAKWLWNETGFQGKTATSDAGVLAWLATALYGDKYTEVLAPGDTATPIEWTCVDPFANALLLQDDQVTFFVRQHPAAFVGAPGSHFERCSFEGFHNDGLYYRGNQSVPVTNVNFSTAVGNGFNQGGGFCISVRGDDANGCTFNRNVAGSAWEYSQALGAAATGGWRDATAAGCNWTDNSCSEALVGYNNWMNNSTSSNVVNGGYSEGGPQRLNAGTIYNCAGGSAAGPERWTPDSAPVAPRFGRGLYGKARTPDGEQDILFLIAGKEAQMASTFGTYAFAFQAQAVGESPGEDFPIRMSWKVAGLSLGYWMLGYAPELNNYAFGHWYVSGDLAPAARDLRNEVGPGGTAGQFGIIKKRLFIGPPIEGDEPDYCEAWGSTTVTYPGEPGIGKWKAGDRHTDRTMYDDPVTLGFWTRRCIVAGDYDATPPVWEPESFAHPDCRPRMYQFETDGTTNPQVIFDGLGVLALAPDSSTEAEVRVVFKVPGDGEGGSALLASTFIRDGSANPFEVSLPTAPPPKLSAGLAGTTVAFNIDTVNDVAQIVMTPGAAVVVAGTIIIVHTRKVDA